MATHVHEVSADAQHDMALHMRYTAVQHTQHTLPLLEPTLASSIASIACNATHVTSRLREADAAMARRLFVQRFEPGATLTGACIETPGAAPRPFYRTVHAMRFEELLVHWLATDVPLHAAFDALDLKLELRSAPPPTGDTHAAEPGWSAAPHTRTASPRRRLFLERVLPGSVRGALNDLGEGVRDSAGALLQISGRLIAGIGGAGGALDGFADSAISTLRTQWEGLAATSRNLFRGFHTREAATAPVTRLNYNNATGRAANRSLHLYHAPWATCSDCFVAADVSAALEIDFSTGGVPRTFHTEVGAKLHGRVKLEVAAPSPTADNDMGNWHALVPRVFLGTYNVMVGYVPVRIDLHFELNAAAWSSHALGDGVRWTAGVEVSADTRLGVHWSADEGWQRVQDVDFNSSAWLPTLSTEAGADGASAAAATPVNASVRASVSPELIMIIWGSAPLE